MREIKLNFKRFYNRRHGRRGYFWGDRFKSVVVEDGNTFFSPWINKYRAVRQGAGDFEKRSISGMCEHFRRARNAA